MVFGQISPWFCGVCGGFNQRLRVCWPSLGCVESCPLWSAGQLCFRWWRVHICEEGRKSKIQACCWKPWNWAHCSMFDNLLVDTNAVQVNSQECTAKAHDFPTHTVWIDHPTQPVRSLCPGKKQPTGSCWLSCLQESFVSSYSGLVISNRTAKEAEEGRCKILNRDSWCCRSSSYLASVFISPLMSPQCFTAAQAHCTKKINK